MTSSYCNQKIRFFYELYLVDMARDGCSTFDGEEKQECLIPVPVLNKALRSRDAQSVNRNGDARKMGDDDIFVRRFTLFDSLSGRDAKYYEDAHKPKLLRFAVEITLRIVASGRYASIYTPILELNTEKEQENPSKRPQDGPNKNRV